MSLPSAYAFEIPFGDREAAAMLITSIPPNWSWIDGQLDAPLMDVFDQKVARAGYLVDRFKDLEIKTLIDCSRERWHRLPLEERARISMYDRESVLELVCQNLLPLFVQFYEAGFDQGQYGPMPFESAKQIAIAYALKGYLGDLFFHSDCYDNCGSYNPERCDIHLAPYSARWHRLENMPPVIPHSELIEAYRTGDEKRVKEIQANNNPPKPQFPALIKVQWEKKYGGRHSRIQGILDVCRDLGLTELDPEPIEYGHSFSELPI